MFAEKAASLVVVGYVCAVGWAAGWAARAESGRVTNAEKEESPVPGDGLAVLFSGEGHDDLGSRVLRAGMSKVLCYAVLCWV